MGLFSKIKQAIVHRKEDRAFRAICDDQRSRKAFRRIYHYHIRKTAGTTINYAFLSNFVNGELDDAWRDIFRAPEFRLVVNGTIIVACNQRLINQGYYNFGFSHLPFHAARPPRDTFTLTCFRDPVKRVVSHYNMLRFYQTQGINHTCMATEAQWLGRSFAEFLSRIPPAHLLNQLYMFSEHYSVDQAIRNVQSLSCFLFTEGLKPGMEEVGRRLNLRLPLSNQKKYGYNESISDGDLERLRKLLNPEYELIDRLHAAGKALALSA